MEHGRSFAWPVSVWYICCRLRMHREGVQRWRERGAYSAGWNAIETEGRLNQTGANNIYTHLKPQGAEYFLSCYDCAPQWGYVCHAQQYSDLRLKLPVLFICSVGDTLCGALREVCLPSKFSCQKVGKRTTRRACVQLQACNIQCSGCPISHSYAKDFSYPVAVLNKTLIYLVPRLSCLLSSPLCFWHSSHSPLFLSSSPAPTSLSLSLYLCAHISLFSPSVFFFLFIFVVILPHALLLPEALPRPGPCCCNNSDKLFGHTFRFVFHPPISPFFLLLHSQFLPSLCHLPHLDKGTSNVNLDRHKGRRTPTEYTHTGHVYTSGSFINCAVCQVERQSP